ncbi:opacity protein-like surface antigen [Pseudaminobacter salicylatoxidans]|uniref:Opacity protein-like surface antigen n=1 Tax=Pseudaminobacter salicylatoxidans TaxID=93369 RepID=A0A316BP84_PSESE|nr:outer membrane protein [Pseudaminobacter salicylatoxidans]PWJ75248.1 opacity protein-like surface antigen [Pseudaminobacter salicylatoxidans]
MRLQSRIFLPLAVAAVWHAGPAMAADYEPPIIVDEGPEYVPVEVGSGWYLRGDVNYNANRPAYKFTFLGEDTDNTRFGGDVGFGYHFTDYLRGDLTMGFVGSDKYGYDDGVNRIAAKNHVWSGLANGYVDLGTVAGLTPYVGAGVGVMYSRAKLDFDLPDLGIAGGGSDKQYRFAYALNAGLSYRFTPNTSVDLGYRYLSSPKMEYLDTDSLTIRKGVDYHQVRVGLRYDLW